MFFNLMNLQPKSEPESIVPNILQGNHCGNNRGSNVDEFVHFWIAYIRTFSYELIEKEKELDTADEEPWQLRMRKMYGARRGDLVVETVDSPVWNIKLNKSYEFGSVIAVKDSNPNEKSRYFVGFQFECGTMRYCLSGTFVYFDEDGKWMNTELSRSILCDYDLRNGNVRPKLYKHALVFAQSHRDTRTEMLSISLFDYEDRMVANTWIMTDIRKSYVESDEELSNDRMARYMKIGEDVWLDLSSAEKMGDKVVIKYEKGINTNEVQKNEVAVTTISKYGDGYPDECVVCREKTAEATLHYGRNATMGLGSGYCMRCEIRYSYSEKRWVCCKIVECGEDSVGCWKEVDMKIGKCVDPEHSGRRRLCHRESYGKKNHRYPYKKIYNVTIENC